MSFNRPEWYSPYESIIYIPSEGPDVYLICNTQLEKAPTCSRETRYYLYTNSWLEGLWVQMGPIWSWSYGSWIYNYLCKWNVLDTTLYDKVCQWLAAGRWFSSGTPLSSTNKTDYHDITDILLKVALNTITLTLIPLFVFCFRIRIHSSKLRLHFPSFNILCSRENNIASVTNINSDHPFTEKYHRIWNIHNQLDWKKTMTKEQKSNKIREWDVAMRSIQVCTTKRFDKTWFQTMKNIYKYCPKSTFEQCICIKF